MGTGRIKWCDYGKGFGFISPEDGGDDLFFYLEDIKENGLIVLDKGQRVVYDIVDGGMVPCVTNVSLCP